MDAIEYPCLNLNYTQASEGLYSCATEQLVSVPEQLVKATEQLRKCSGAVSKYSGTVSKSFGAVTRVFRSSYEIVPEQLVSLSEHF